MQGVKRVIRGVAVILGVGLLMTPAVFAHRGEVDGLGCHKERVTTYYHCHEGPLEGRSFANRTGAVRALKKLEKKQEEATARQVAATRQSVMEAGRSYGPYSADLIEVVDGNTMLFNVFHWPGLIQRSELHLDGVEVPRLFGPSDCERALAGRAAAKVGETLGGATLITVSDVHAGQVAGRAVGRVSADGVDLGEMLIEDGLGRAASSDARPWC
ncbi:MAG: thermonuclease family protein [Leptospirillia bacterium]